MSPTTVVGYVWFGWLVSWRLAALWQERIAKRAPTTSEIAYRLLSIIGACLLVGVAGRYTGAHLYLWMLPIGGCWTSAAVVVVGLAFSWWARLHIGRLWSSGVSRKAEHHVVTTGPYGLVRHPIYSGLMLSVLATAVLLGTVAAWLGAATLGVGFYVKARLEEGFLRLELGQAYGEYAEHVGMLVPLVGRARP